MTIHEADARCIAHLARVLTDLHDRGLVNEVALLEVLQHLIDGAPLTLDHLIAIFGVGPIYHLVTIPDETARQLLREAFDVLNNPESRIDLRDWTRAAGHLL